jgi:hypothetical protein
MSWDQEVELSLVAQVKLDSQAWPTLLKQSEAVGVVFPMPEVAEEGTWPGSHGLQDKCSVGHCLEVRSY